MQSHGEDSWVNLVAYLRDRRSAAWKWPWSEYSCRAETTETLLSEVCTPASGTQRSSSTSKHQITTSCTPNLSYCYFRFSHRAVWQGLIAQGCEWMRWIHVPLAGWRHTAVMELDLSPRHRSCLLGTAIGRANKLQSLAFIQITVWLESTPTIYTSNAF